MLGVFFFLKFFCLLFPLVKGAYVGSFFFFFFFKVFLSSISLSKRGLCWEFFFFLKFFCLLFPLVKGAYVGSFFFLSFFVFYFT